MSDHALADLTDAELASRIVAKCRDELVARSELAELRVEQRRRAAVVAARYRGQRAALRGKRRELSSLGMLEQRVGLELATVVASCPYIGPFRMLGIATARDLTEQDLSRRLGKTGKRWLRERFGADATVSRFTELITALNMKDRP